MEALSLATEEEKFGIAQDELDGAAGGGGLGLQLVEEPKQRHRRGALVDRLTEDDQRVESEAPFKLGVDDAMDAEEIDRGSVFGMNIRKDENPVEAIAWRFVGSGSCAGGRQAAGSRQSREP